MFWFRLAAHLGWPVAVLQQHVDSVEFSEWMEFYQMEPFGEYRDDLRAGVVASVVANANRRKGAKPLTAEDFVLRFRAKKSARQSMGLLRQIAQAVGRVNGQ